MKNNKKEAQLMEKISNKQLYKEIGLDTYTPIASWYTTNFGQLPEYHIFGRFKIDEIIKKYQDKVITSFKSTYHQKKNDKDIFTEYYNEICFLLDETGIVMRIGDGDVTNDDKKERIGRIAFFYQSKKHNLSTIIEEIQKYFYHREEKNNLSIVCKDDQGLFTKEFKIKEPVIDFDLNYNEDFKEIKDLIIEKLNTDNNKGIIIFQGNPGTGKTTMIRYLINHVRKPVIYIPPDMARELSSPTFVPFLMDNPNSILVIEDAENVLMKREEGFANQAVSNLLNISDGLLSECLNITILATCNINISALDQALLRKGRLIAKYEFKELEESRAKLLAKKLNVKLNSKATVAEIYNAVEMEFSDKKETIGFKVAAG